jgi:hypothetical protein
VGGNQTRDARCQYDKSAMPAMQPFVGFPWIPFGFCPVSEGLDPRRFPTVSNRMPLPGSAREVVIGATAVKSKSFPLPSSLSRFIALPSKHHPNLNGRGRLRPLTPSNELSNLSRLQSNLYKT